MAQRQIVLDTETTGLDYAQGHRIIEIAAVELIDRNLSGKHFHYYFNPQREIDAGAQAVHGISSEFLADKPLFNDQVSAFLAFIKNAQLIIHNASFDIGFLDNELRLVDHTLGCMADYCHVIDTLALARQRHPGQKNNLDALCKRYKIDNSQRQLHGALLDAELLAKVYLAMTGGQGTLFAGGKSSVVEIVQQQTQVSYINRNGTPLRVIKANAEELKLHEEKMAKLLEG